MPLYITLIEERQHKTRFEQIYYNFRSSMSYIAKRILQDEALAEDAVSEAFLLIANNISQISAAFL